MKKFLALLLMALLLIPALAMAEKPPEKIDVDALAASNQLRLSYRDGVVSSFLVYSSMDNGNFYDAYYTFDGNLHHYEYTFNCECKCKAMFSLDGSLYDGSQIVGRNLTPAGMGGGEYYWDIEQNQWVWEYYEGEQENPPAPISKHNPYTEHKIAPYTYSSVQAQFPPATAMEAIGYNGTFKELVKAAYSLFPAKRPTDTSGYTMIGVSPSSSSSTNKPIYLYKKDSQFGTVRALYSMSGDLAEVYIGNLAFNTYRKDVLKSDDEYHCCYSFDSKYGIFTDARYDWNDGSLKTVVIRSMDYNSVFGYTPQNVLKTCEVYKRIDGVWDAWEYGFEDSPDFWIHNGVREQPSDDFLRNLTIPGIANYRTPVASSESSLSEEERKAAHVVAGNGALSDPNATVKVEAEKLDNENGSVYNIDIVTNGTDNKVTLTQPVTLSLPYPNGMSEQTSDGYGFAVIHTKDKQSQEIMSSEDGGIQFTENGLQVTATSFSPYKVIWGTKTEIAANYKSTVPTTTATPVTPNLPQTGDTSNLALYAALLTLSVGALAVVLVMGKRRASR